jgi:hypothetical protein
MGQGLKSELRVMDGRRANGLGRVESNGHAEFVGFSLNVCFSAEISLGIFTLGYRMIPSAGMGQI